MLPVFVVSLHCWWNLVLVLAFALLRGTFLDPVSPSAPSSAPGLPRAHPRERGPPHLVVPVAHLVGESERHASVWGQSRGSNVSAEGIWGSKSHFFESISTVTEDICGFAVLLTRMVVFMPPGPFMCYCRTHVAVGWHGAARSLLPPAWSCQKYFKGAIIYKPYLQYALSKEFYNHKIHFYYFFPV